MKPCGRVGCGEGRGKGGSKQVERGSLPPVSSNCSQKSERGPQRAGPRPQKFEKSKSDRGQGLPVLAFFFCFLHVTVRCVLWDVHHFRFFVYFATVDVAHVSLDSNPRNHTHRYDHDKDVLEPEREGQRERSFMSATFATLNRSRSRVRGLVEDPQGPGGSSRAGQSFHPRSPHI